MYAQTAALALEVEERDALLSSIVQRLDGATTASIGRIVAVVLFSTAGLSGIDRRGSGVTGDGNRRLSLAATRVCVHTESASRTPLRRLRESLPSQTLLMDALDAAEAGRTAAQRELQAAVSNQAQSREVRHATKRP